MFSFSSNLLPGYNFFVLYAKFRSSGGKQRLSSAAEALPRHATAPLAVYSQAAHQCSQWSIMQSSEHDQVVLQRVYHAPINHPGRRVVHAAIRLIRTDTITRICIHAQ